MLPHLHVQLAERKVLLYFHYKVQTQYYICVGRIIASHHPRRHISSFKFACKGIQHAFLNEANFRIQTAIAFVCFVAGIYFKISLTEWLALITVCGMLLSAELINTTIEEFIDHLVHEHHEGARIIKDLAAGYVLTVSLFTLFVLLLVFVPHIFRLQV